MKPLVEVTPSAKILARELHNLIRSLEEGYCVFPEDPSLEFGFAAENVIFFLGALLQDVLALNLEVNGASAAKISMRISDLETATGYVERELGYLKEDNVSPEKFLLKLRNDLDQLALMQKLERVIVRNLEPDKS